MVLVLWILGCTDFGVYYFEKRSDSLVEFYLKLAYCLFQYTSYFLFLKIESCNKFYIKDRTFCIKNTNLPYVFKD